MAKFINNRNNGAYAPKKAASTVISVGDFLVPTGMGSYIPYSASQTLYLTGIVGTFVKGETVTGGTSAATGVVLVVTTAGIVVGTIVGTFVTAEVVTGGTSAATGTTAAIPFNTKIFGLSNEEIQSTDSDFATVRPINVSTPVNLQDYLEIPVSSGTATALMVGQYFNVDPANPDSIIVSAAGTQIYVTEFINASLVRGIIALHV